MLSNENNDRNIGISYKYFSGFNIAIYLSKLKLSVFLRKYITNLISSNVDVRDCFPTFSDRKSDTIILYHSTKPVETIILTLLVNNDMLRVFSNAGSWNILVNYGRYFIILQERCA